MDYIDKRIIEIKSTIEDILTGPEKIDWSRLKFYFERLHLFETLKLVEENKNAKSD